MIDWLAERFAPGEFFGYVCIAGVLLLPLVLVRAHRRSKSASLRFSSTAKLAAVGRSWVTRTRALPAILRALAIAALLIALARPQAGGEYRQSREGIAIQMVMDVSGSMAEDDFLLSGRPVRRLDAVKKVFKDFVLGDGDLGGRENDLIGMTTFAMFADTAVPLTLDHASLLDLLEEAEIPGWVNGRQVRESEESGFTSIGEAIVLATDDLRRAGEQAIEGVPGAEAAKSKVMILLTDGADNPARIEGVPAPDPVDAAEVAAQLGIRVYTIGAGGDAPRRRGFFVMPRHQVDERLLKRIAETTGGKFFRATDTESLATIYDEIDRLERRSTGERVYRDDVWAAKLAMFCGLGLVMLEFLLVQTRYRTLP